MKRAKRPRRERLMAEAAIWRGAGGRAWECMVRNRERLLMSVCACQVGDELRCLLKIDGTFQATG